MHGLHRPISASSSKLLRRALSTLSTNRCAYNLQKRHLRARHTPELYGNNLPQFCTMARKTTGMQNVLEALENMFPCTLGEEWDNVGLLVGVAKHAESTSPENVHVFLTNDLTLQVLDEAISIGSHLIVTYHPTPFRPLKKVTMDTVPGEIILRCAAQGIAVYSPHTACDNAKGGVNDWLLAGLNVCAPDAIAPITPLPVDGSGRGRMATCKPATTLGAVVAAVKQHLGLERLRVCPSSAARRNQQQYSIERIVADTVATKVAVCAGSGVSVLTGCGADVWVTGEMSHHDLLAANAAGVSVILTEHSNSERGYLTHLAQRLVDTVGGNGITCTVSAVDADPVSIL
eukprot:m.151508 g.151508  ORF g.151508 m.151508 type:complete len:345 (-) comp17867_c1_seq3:457-1491(-)